MWRFWMVDLVVIHQTGDKSAATQKKRHFQST